MELRSPDPSVTRSNHDRVMIILGVLLTLFFIVAGYLALLPGDKHTGMKPRGPVKDPRVLNQPQLPRGAPSSLGTQ